MQQTETRMYFLSRFEITIKNSDKNYQTKIDFFNRFYYFMFLNFSLEFGMENEIVIHSEIDLRSKIYTIRGVQVMLDFDLAEIYGYSVKAFNRQVKNNIDKFDNEFMFQLNEYEYSFLRCKFCTSKIEARGGRRYFPYAFTEQGIYMLMTVLRGDLAIRQSKILIRLFKGMKDFRD